MNLQNISEWELMKNGQFQDAYQLLSRLVEENPTSKSRYLYNRALCLLSLSQPEKALLDFNEFIVDKPDTSSGYIGAGICTWWLRKNGDTFSYWQKALGTKYTDSASGIEPASLLYFFSIKTNDLKLKKEVLNLLTKKIKRSNLTKWPEAIASFLTSTISYSEFYQSASSSENLMLRRLCKFYFWVAIKNLEENSLNIYDHNLKLSGQTNSILEHEYFLAKIELLE